ncbi:MAG: DUF6079 family protein [Acidobacteriota bacterium]
MKPASIRDLVDVIPRPTVVRLDDLQTDRAGWITENYFVTGEVGAHLRVMQELLGRSAGSGVFLIGQYGSGKSHFLAYIAQKICSGEFVESAPEVAAISLLNFSSDTRIEDIIGRALGIATGREDRRIAWSSFQQNRTVLLILDELSEFLRSKPTRESFNEDVRFLQFTGEWALGNRFWVLAAMQEQIEHTGDLEYDLFRKIKDRFPVRLLLTPAHVRDLISQSILIKKPGYDEAVGELLSRLRAAMPGNVKVDLQALASTYPLHPATLDLLAEVRDRFSQARGVVDFVVTQLRGDPARRSAPFLDKPWGSLLTPDFIVDHFQDTLETQPEFLPLAQRLFPYYRIHIAEIFSTEPQRTLAWRVIKLLMLAHMSPSRDGFSAAEAASLLLATVALTDPAKNVKVVENILRSLVQKGRYVQQQGDAYSLNLEDRGEEDLEKMLQREIAELQGRGEIVFEGIIPFLGETGFNPFALARDEWQPRMIRWHFHDRTIQVYFGDGQPPAREGPALCIRLPWGEAEPAPGCYTLIPERMEIGEELVELAAMARLRGKVAGGDVASRLERRMSPRLALFRSRLSSVYLEARVAGPAGEPEGPLRIDTSGSAQSWLAKYGQYVLRRYYPAFERFAPGYGPLANEAYRRFMRWSAQHDPGEYEADEFVKLIREAYLAPMGLLQRKGRNYALPAHLERNELVSLLRPLLEHHPAPKVVYEHLASPVYGLVPDQIHLLLIFLLLQGDIDILKDRQSYRELFEALPTPIQYDRIVPGRALSVEQLRELEKLCKRFGARVPAQWTVIGQRNAVRQLREAGHRESTRLQQALLKIAQAPGAAALSEKLARVVRLWNSLEAGDSELQGFQQFLYEAGTAELFVSLCDELEGAPERIEKILAELQRFSHLLGHPALASCRALDLGSRVEALGPPPGLDNMSEVDQWLARAHAIYEDHKTSYARLHADWWGKGHAIWEWDPPKVVRSRHVALEAELKQMQACRDRARALRCRGLVNLDFQPVCPCGFDGERAPIAEEMRAFETLREKIESTLTLFFGQESVRERLRKEWVEVNPRTSAYLENRADYPEIDDLDLLDQLLGGVSLVAQVEVEALLEPLCGATWERAELAAAIERELGRIEAARIRLKRRSGAEPDEIALWCAEQSLRHGVPLPKGLGADMRKRIGEHLQPEWVSAESLSRLEQLGFDESAEEQILRWLLDGRLGPAPSRSGSPLVAAAVDLVRPQEAGTAERLRSVAAALYRQHHRMLRVAPQRWLERLDALARTELRPQPPGLAEALRQHTESQWIMVDCLGLPLFAELRSSIEEVLAAWRVATDSYAMVSSETTTDACYRTLIESGHVRSFVKIDAVDQLLHRRFPPFEDLVRIAAAELRLALGGVRKRLDQSKPLLLFADHGFRIALDGGSYTHGGDSTLERLVPLLSMAPR